MIVTRETTWFPESQKRIQEIASKIFKASAKYIDVKIENPREVCLRVHANSLELLKLTREMFPSSSKKEQQAQLYFMGEKDKKVLGKFGYLVDSLATTCLGLYDEASHTALIVGGSGYGLLKSVIIGLASTLFQPEYHPVHGAAFRYGQRNILMLGHHGAGKTTTLLHLFHYSEPGQVKILTDDWSVWSNNQNGFQNNVQGIAIEKKISFTRTFTKEFSYLNLEKIFNSHSKKGMSKVYLSPDELYGKNTSLETMGIDVVVLLQPRSSGALIRKATLNEVISLLVDSTYHMPDTNEDIKKEAYSFWRNNLQNKKLVSLDTRSPLPLEKFCKRMRIFLLLFLILFNGIRKDF